VPVESPTLASAPSSPAAAPDDEDGELADPFRVRLPTLLVANKSDLDPEPDEVKVLEELLGVRYPAVTVSAETGAGLPVIGSALFHGLGIVRVYTKIPGREADRGRPYTLRRGGTVLEVAHLVHKDVAGGLKFAKMWGRDVFDGQQVGPDHPVSDGDVVELHT
jgi:ribosome-interacting GTPase 1